MKVVGQAYGTESQIAQYTGNTGAPGQLVWSTDGKRFYAFNGSTKGGFRIAMYSEIQSLQNTVNGKANASHTHSIGNVTNLQSTLDGKVIKSGSRGTLAGYEALQNQGSAFTINNDSGDNYRFTAAARITVANGAANQTWTKVVGITNASATISLGSSWKWSGGETPTVKANSVLVLKWLGTFGFAALQNTTA
ncbi:hypothetical protein [Parasutterella secunda]|uniref:Phage tail protein n=1 Tax=Parasutterella secunda TaxID=626947 RepID=A0ABS2GTA0_9BURK|nr:hypothetical protein [Parasutterella secunda]MBM6928179.1 hypothetical protein [Parasutterella secunda]